MVIILKSPYDLKMLFLYIFLSLKFFNNFKSKLTLQIFEKSTVIRANKKRPLDHIINVSLWLYYTVTRINQIFKIIVFWLI